MMGKEHAGRSVTKAESSDITAPTKSTEAENYEYCHHMYRGVVHAFVGCTAAWLESLILSPPELSC